LTGGRLCVCNQREANVRTGMSGGSRKSTVVQHIETRKSYIFMMSNNSISTDLSDVPVNAFFDPNMVKDTYADFVQSFQDKPRSGNALRPLL